MLVYLQNIFSRSKSTVIHFLLPLHISHLMLWMASLSGVILFWPLLVMAGLCKVLTDLCYILIDAWLFIFYIGYYFVDLATIFLTSWNNFITISVTTSLVTTPIYLVLCLPSHILSPFLSPPHLSQHKSIWFFDYPAISYSHKSLLLCLDVCSLLSTFTVCFLTCISMYTDCLLLACVGHVLISPLTTYLIIIHVQFHWVLAVV